MTTSSKRTYLVVEKQTGYGRLVKTNSGGKATSYVVGDRYLTRVATQDDIIIALNNGVPVEELDEAGKLITSAPAVPQRRHDDVPEGAVA